ncbi:hypothetical protein [Pseudomonas lactucae]|uniref:Uncharacterized protein n=1 Tax=Pseudomonas lactucae TaxID=2813360 RepID=A0A9X1C598_9PSED|nr:hypothetical protein [Pseudomonas lactucae]MBN2975830.1 hypothetical protein [Pseudomonas lactucae]MBN2985000.1 hypothetical protein [Pseudomonas lactucae]
MVKPHASKTSLAAARPEPSTLSPEVALTGVRNVVNATSSSSGRLRTRSLKQLTKCTRSSIRPMALLAETYRLCSRFIASVDKADQSDANNASRTWFNSPGWVGGVTPYQCKTALREKAWLSGGIYATPLPAVSKAPAAARNRALTCHQPDVSLSVNVLRVARRPSITNPVIESAVTTRVSNASPLLMAQSRICAELKALRNAENPG